MVHLKYAEVGANHGLTILDRSCGSGEDAIVVSSHQTVDVLVTASIKEP
jgi:hypothetical protein